MEEQRMMNTEETGDEVAAKRSNINPEAFCSSATMELVIQNLPPRGYVFQPSDTLLISDFLMCKINNQRLPLEGTNFWDLHASIYTYNPLHLAKYHKLRDLEAMFFFVPKRLQNQQNRKEANILMKENRRRIGVREPLGFWKSNGSIKLILKNGCTIGCKKTFIFYGNETTDWMMEEYRIIKNNIKLDDWILCKLYRKDSDSDSDSDADADADADADSDSDSDSD